MFFGVIDRYSVLCVCKNVRTLTNPELSKEL